MNTYTEAADFLAKGRDPNYRKIANNTTVERREGDNIAVRLHATDVVTYHPDGSVTLDSGGWRTYTTKDRMNAFGPALVWQDQGEWEVGIFRPREDGSRYYGEWIDSAQYRDGMTIEPGGSLQAYKAERFAEFQESGLDRTERDQRADVRAYVAGFVAHIKENGLDQPSGGDCWGCAMRATADVGLKSGETLGTGHYLDHMEEGYYVPSLLYNAIEWAGYRDPALTFRMYTEDYFRFSRESAKNVLTRTLTRFLYSRLGLVI